MSNHNFRDLGRMVWYDGIQYNQESSDDEDQYFKEAQFLFVNFLSVQTTFIT